MTDDSSIRPEPTGDPRVDAVLDRLAGLEGSGLDDQVAALERAHEELRAALASAGDEPDS